MNLLFAILLVGKFAQAEPQCDLNFIIGSCEKLKSSGLLLKKYDNGTFLVNQTKLKNFDTEKTRDEKQILDQVVSANPINLEATKKLFSDIKITIADQIIKNRLIKTLDPSEKNLLERVRTSGLKVIQGYDSMCESEPPKGAPNAEYVAEQNTIWVCPAMINSPKLDQAQTFSHEFGHLLSPCQLGGFYKINKVALKKNKVGQTLYETCLARENGALGRHSLPSSYSTFGPLDVANKFKDQPKCRFNSLYTKVENGLDANYPYKDLRSCFIKKYSKVQSSEVDYTSGKNVDKDECGPTSLEPYADVIGAAILGGYLEKFKPSHDIDSNIELLGQYSMWSCPNKYFQSDGTHPEGEGRIKVYWEDERVQKFLGCKSSINTYCENLVFQDRAIIGNSDGIKPSKIVK